MTTPGTDKIANRPTHDVRVILKQPHGAIAPIAEQPADRSRFVVVIDMKSSARSVLFGRPADSASTMLRLHHRIILSASEPIPL